jgi:hypothetical protein
MGGSTSPNWFHKKKQPVPPTPPPNHKKMSAHTDYEEEEEEEEEEEPPRTNLRRKRPLEWQPYFIEAEGLDEADLDLKRCGICWVNFQKGDLLIDLICCQSRKRIHQTCAVQCLSQKPNTCPYCGYDNIDLIDDILTFN